MTYATYISIACALICAVLAVAVLRIRSETRLVRERALEALRPGARPAVTGGPGMFAFGSTVRPGHAKVVEECGEVTQAIGKMMMVDGASSHWSHGDLDRHLSAEIADLLAALQFVVEQDDRLNRRLIRDRTAAKLYRFRSWHRHQAGGVSVDPPTSTPDSGGSGLGWM